MAARAAVAAFEGAQFVTGAADIAAWVKRAASGERLAYCEAPQLLRGEGADAARALASDGLVTLHQQRREGGGFRFLMIRTGRGMPSAKSVAASVLDDPVTDAIYRAIKRAANFGARCPSDAELAAMVLDTSALSARVAGGFTRDQAQWRVRKLVDAGLIASRAVTEGGETWRVATILAGEGSGKSTKLPPKAAAFAAAVNREAR